MSSPPAGTPAARNAATACSISSLATRLFMAVRRNSSEPVSMATQTERHPAAFIARAISNVTPFAEIPLGVHQWRP